jgi:hypothetical protein
MTPAHLQAMIDMDNWMHTQAEAAASRSVTSANPAADLAELGLHLNRGD